MKKTILLNLVVLLVIVASAPAATRLVPDQYSTIQAAINDCNDGDVVIVATGTYTGPGNRDIDFKGKAITVRSIDPNDPAVVASTIVDCQSAGRGFHFQNGEEGNSVLAGLTITKGLADYAGGIFCDNASPAITRCTFTNCIASEFGGAILSYKGSPTITHSKFSNNHASYEGGAIDFGYGTPLVSNCVITGNSAATGGGIHAVGSALTIANCMITDNFADGGVPFLRSGGGIYSIRGNPIITNCTIANNSSVGTGGGITCYQNKPTITNSIIWGNTAPSTTNVYGQPLVSYSNIQGGFSGTGNIDADPLFVDLGSGNFHLSAASPCIDAGDPAYSPPPGQTDIDGDPRLLGLRVDMGADEVLNDALVIAVFPNVVRFNILEGRTNLPEKTIQIWNAGIGTLNWQITEDCPWLQVNPQAGTSTNEPNQVILTVDPTSLHWGQYDCQLSVSDPCAINSPRMVDVLLDVIGPDIKVSAAHIQFSAYEGDAVLPQQTFTICNDGGGLLSWQAGTDCDWLDVSPTTGTSRGDANEITLTADVSDLPWGHFDCSLTISDPNASNSPVTLPVSLELTGPILSVSSNRFDFQAEKENPTPSDQTLSIQNTAGGTLNWQITAPNDCNWLTANPLTGRSIGDVNEVTLSVDTTGLAHGFYSCDLTITDPNASNSPQTIEVRLLLRLVEQGRLYVPDEFPNIQTAIDWALPGDVVVVAPGTYTGPGNRDIDFRGKPITVRSIDPNDPQVVASTVIDCNASQSDQHRGFNFHTGEDANSILNGFTIVNGCSDRGGGIYCQESSPTITNCTITGNSAEWLGRGGGYGGGMHNIRSSPTVTNCTFSGNSAKNYGGGMANGSSSNPTVTNCIFSGNEANDGGGMANEGSSPTVTNCTFTGNEANYGGGMRNTRSSTPTVTNCTFSGNSATNYGGGMYNGGSNPTVTNCILWGNLPDEIYVSSGTPVVTYSDVVKKSWPGEGNINVDPCFVEAGYWADVNDPDIIVEPDDPNAIWVDGDYHLMSEGWRWYADRNTWAWDDVTSPCIDAGNPGSPLGDEPLAILDDPYNEWGQNLRINMGAYGGTAEASMPPYDWALLADLTNDGIVDFTDLANWSEDCLISGSGWPGDLDRNAIVNMIDFAWLAQDWHAETSWSSLLPGQASNPTPADGSTGVYWYLDLSWAAGSYATSHDVYFGTSSPPPFIRNQINTTFDPGGLAFDTQYFWRIDEVNRNGTTTGTVWSFTTTTGGKTVRCFPADTLVWADGKLVPILEVLPGQKVGKLDSADGKPGPIIEMVPGQKAGKLDSAAEIEWIEEHGVGTYDCYDVVFESGNSIVVVHSHYFLTVSGEWVAVENLTSGSKLQSLNGPISITSVVKRAMPFVGNAYNLKIKGANVYFVGKDGVAAVDCSKLPGE